MEIYEETVTDWSKLQTYARKKKWLFRGESSTKWDLRTSLDRCLDRALPGGSDRREIERALIREFQRAYHQYATHIPPQAHNLEWLAMMQHHGAPTRLLDFSYSVYVAAYFGLESLQPSGTDASGNPFPPNDGRIWAVNGPWALAHAANKLWKEPTHHEGIEYVCNEYLFDEVREDHINSLFFEDRGELLVCPINPYRLNERIRTQKGVFLIQGSVQQSMAENLEAMPGYDDPDNVVKLILPYTERDEFLRDLYNMNISHTSLFPGIDGFARSLGVYTTAFNPGVWVEQTASGDWEPV